MNRFEAMIMALAIEEYAGDEWRITKYSGRGMNGRETLAFVSGHKAHSVLAMTTGYALGKTYLELAEEIIANRQLFSDWLDVVETDPADTAATVLAETLENELEFVKGYATDSLGYQTVIY